MSQFIDPQAERELVESIHGKGKEQTIPFDISKGTDWLPVHRQTLQRLGDRENLRAGIGKLSPALCKTAGMTKEQSNAIEALCSLLEAEDFHVVPPPVAPANTPPAVIPGLDPRTQPQSYRGHKTMADGSTVPLSQDEAAAIWNMVEASKAKREADMPDARAALAVICSAEQRLNDLGWRKGGGTGIKRGDKCAVAQPGSTGMWKGWIDDDGDVHFGDCHAARRDCFLKPLADLSDGERSWMEECDRNEAEAFRAMLDRSMSDGQP